MIAEETLIMNEIGQTLKNLQKRGIGYIDLETTGEFHYVINDKKIKIETDVLN